MRVSFRLSDYEAEVLLVAARMWPEHEANKSELIRQVLADWRRLREDNGIGTRAQTARMLRLICKHLGIDTEAINGAS